MTLQSRSARRGRTPSREVNAHRSAPMRNRHAARPQRPLDTLARADVAPARRARHLLHMTSTFSSDWISDRAASREASLARIDALSRLFDVAFILPGTNVRFGIEALLRLIPGIGDAAASALSCYLLYEAHRLGVPSRLFARMLLNVAVEGVVGAV